MSKLGGRIMGLFSLSGGQAPVIVGGDTTSPGLGTINFAAIGGAAPYVWSLSTNASGGSIDAVTGVYTAGAAWNGSVDIVRVTGADGLFSQAHVVLIVPLFPTGLGFSPAMIIEADAGITIVTGVSNWADQSGNGVTYTQASAPAQPTRTLNAQNSLPKVSFASANLQFMVSAKLMSDIATQTAWTFFFAGNVGVAQAAENATLFLNPTAGAGDSSWISGPIISSTHATSYQFTSATKKAPVNITPGTAFYSTHYIDGTNIFAQLNQTGAVTGDLLGNTALTTMSTALKIGRDAGNTHYGDFDIFAMCAFKGNLIAGDKLKMQKYYSAKWFNGAI